MKPEGISVSIENSYRGIAIDTRSTNIFNTESRVLKI